LEIAMPSSWEAELPPFMIATPTSSAVVTPRGDREAYCAPHGGAGESAEYCGVVEGTYVTAYETVATTANTTTAAAYGAYEINDTVGLIASMPFSQDGLQHPQTQVLSPQPQQPQGLSPPQSMVHTVPKVLSPALPPVVLRLSEAITNSEGGTGPTEHSGPLAAAAAAARMDRKLYGAGSSSIAGASTTTGSTTIPPSVPSEAGDAMHRPSLGSAEMPSRGSALHQFGACKPCAFVFAEGCMNDINCQFCHLCEPGEKKRRRKERRKVAAGAKPR
jgi:hypothetical protein